MSTMAQQQEKAMAAQELLGEARPAVDEQGTEEDSLLRLYDRVNELAVGRDDVAAYAHAAMGRTLGWIPPAGFGAERRPRDARTLREVVEAFDVATHELEVIATHGYVVAQPS